MGGRGSSSRLAGSAKPAGTEKPSYHYFYDKASGGFNYEGDGHHQEAWFKANSNVDEVINATDESTKRAMREWASGYFMSGQQYEGWDRMSMTEKEFTQRYDDMLDKSVLHKGVTVVRRTTAELLFGKGKTSATLEELKAMKGKTILSAGNMSTGAAAQGLTIGSYNKDHEFRIHIPAGSKGAGMWIGDRRINPGWGPDQREFMMNRDIGLKVGDTTYDSSRGVYVTDVTFVERYPHDYGKSGRLKL